MEQTDADRLSGVLRLRFGSVEKEIPALPIRPAKQWIGLLTEKLTAIASTAGEPGADALMRLASDTTDAAADLVIAYDRTGAIGGLDWLGNNADALQVRAALDTMREHAIPFGDEAGLMQIVLMAAQSAALNSTNGHSPSGDSPPASSKRRSRRTS